MLLALRKIVLHQGFLRGGWPILPQSFRLAFFDCLLLPSMHDVPLIRVTHFPFTYFLNKHLRRLMVDCCIVNSIPTDEPALNGSACHPNDRSASFDSLSLHGNNGDAILAWVTTFVLKLRSLEFSLYEYDSPSVLLTSYSNILTNLCLDIGISRTCMVPFHEFG